MNARGSLPPLGLEPAGSSEAAAETKTISTNSDSERGSTMDDFARRLARWATAYQPTAKDLELAHLALTDTVSVALAARDEPMLTTAAELPRAERWAVAAHILDFDDLHLPSTTHISTVCVPAALASDAGAEAYLVGAGVMARVGTALGHAHYTSGWHATATAGAVASAAVASRALGLDEQTTARAMALAVSSAGGVQGAFGTDGKSLQVGFAVGAGLRAARMAARGASAEPLVLEQWVRLLGGDPTFDISGGPVIPDGLAIKLYPCCYALQRPIGAVAASLARAQEGTDRRTGGTLTASEVKRVVVRTPLSTVKPLIHARPTTGLEGKFSLQYAVAATILDTYPGLAAFTDEAVSRKEAQQLLRRVEVQTSAGGQGLLVGAVEIEVETLGGTFLSRLAMPPGSPANPATPDALTAKFATCLAGSGVRQEDITWASAADLLDSLWAGDRAAATPAFESTIGRK